jgi:RNA polymerase sigma-70 factor, ECF subfamily
VGSIGENRGVRRTGSLKGLARREAFMELHSAHATGIFNLALRLLGNREDAQDISQEVLLKAYQRLAKPGVLDERSWLYRVTVNACYDQLRRRKRRPSVSWEPELEFDMPRATDACEQAETRRHLEEALRRVPPAQRAALLLREVHGLPVAEVATALGIRPGSAEVTLVRARTSFRRHFTQISEYGLDAGRELAVRRRPPKDFLPVEGLAMALGLPGLVFRTVPLPGGLTASSVLSGAGASVGIGGVVTAVVAKATAVVSTKVAVMAIGASLVAGSAGGLYTAEHGLRPGAGAAPHEPSAGLVTSAVSSPTAAVATEAAAKASLTASSPATATVTPAEAAVVAPSADPSASPSPDPGIAEPPLVLGESGAPGTGGSETSTSTAGPPLSSTDASPTPSSSPTPSPTASPSPSSSASPSTSAGGPTPAPAAGGSPGASPAL